MTSICVGVFFYGRPSASRFLERKLRKELYVCSTRYRSLRWGTFLLCWGKGGLEVLWCSANDNDIPLYVGQPTTAAQGHQLFCQTYFARDIKTYTAIYHPKQATSQSQHQCQRLFCRTYFSIGTKIYTTIHQHQTSNKPTTSPP